MDLGDGSVGDILEKEINIETKINIIHDMIRLINKQIDNGIYCIDIKPDNFIYTLKKNKMKIFIKLNSQLD